MYLNTPIEYNKLYLKYKRTGGMSTSGNGGLLGG